MDQYQGAGAIGFGFDNKALKSMIHYNYTGFTLQLSNFTDLSFA